jgi:hypothetical protein
VPYLKDPSSGQPSPTLTLMVGGVLIMLLKLLFADSTVFGLKLGAFSGGDFAMAVSPLLALYGHKRAIGAKQSEEKQD